MSIARFGLSIASTFAALTFGLMNHAAATPAPQAAPPQAAAVASESQSHTSPQRQVWTYSVDTATLNQYLNAWATAQGQVQTPLGGVKLGQLRTDIRDGQLVVSGTADSGMLKVPVDAAATASSGGGSIQVHIVQAHINGMDMPDGARSQIEQELQTQLAQSLTAYHVSVRSVQLDDGKLLVSGTTF